MTMNIISLHNFFLVVLFIVLYGVVLTLGSANENLTVKLLMKDNP